MNSLFYPAIFHKADEGGYWVSFPDFPECLTQGESVQESFENATDALELCIEDRKKENQSIPEASAPDQIGIESGDVIYIVQFDEDKYRRKHNSKAVKKTLTIPEWLNEEAMEANINFSQVLQEALMQKLSLK